MGQCRQILLEVYLLAIPYQFLHLFRFGRCPTYLPTITAYTRPVHVDISILHKRRGV